MVSGDGAEANCAGEGRGIESEGVDVGELAEADAVGEDEVVVGIGEGDVGGVCGIGKLDEEAAISGGVGQDAEDLEEDGAVLPGGLGVGIHGLEKLEEEAWCETRHLRLGNSAAAERWRECECRCFSDCNRDGERE